MRSLTLTTIACALAAGTLVPLAAPSQDRPGIPTQARVWVENHDVNESIPVALTSVDPSLPPLRAQLTGASAVSITGIVEARLRRSTWEYQTMTVQTGQNAAAALNAAGAEGWELTGLATPTANGFSVIMKRPQ